MKRSKNRSRKPCGIPDDPTQSSPRDWSPKMRRLLRRIKSALRGCIAKKQTITYAELAWLLGGYLPRSMWIAMCLGRLCEEDTLAGNPLRSALVVLAPKGDVEGMASHGFFECARYNGHVFTDDVTFWQAQLDGLFAQGPAAQLPAPQMIPHIVVQRPAAEQPSV
jgi:hypothetical protein